MDKMDWKFKKLLSNYTHNRCHMIFAVVYLRVYRYLDDLPVLEIHILWFIDWLMNLNVNIACVLKVNNQFAAT